MTWRTIVVGTDGSEGAEKAVAHAGALSAALGADLVVVCAYSDDRDGPPRDAVPADLEWAATAAGNAQAAARRGAELADALGARGATPLSMPGLPLEVLAATAREHDAGLIVVGSRGMRSASRFIVGSVANEVTHHANCDVLVVRTD